MRPNLRGLLRGLALGAIAIGIGTTASADQPSDAWITTKTKIALLTDDVVPGMDVNVDTFDGNVALHGAVGSEAEKMRAEEKAKSIAGVKKVRNLLAVVPEEARDAQAVEDAELERQVATVLNRDKALEDSDISVKSVNDGVIVLAGDAKTLSDHQRALEDARSIDGVRQVASEIQSPDELGDAEIWNEEEDFETASAGSSASDAWITTKAKVFLMGAPGLSPVSINVDTDRGVVTLFGIVGTEATKERAGMEVAKISGVKNVENELQVVPDVAAERVEAADDEVLAAVESRLEARAGLGDADIDVEVKNHVVRLTGTVASQSDRVTALTVARGTNSVDSVIDDMRLAQP